MAYQVLARKWRPHNFPEMVGQKHVLRALTNALENDRLHHAYLFTGTRGVGKTTIARILAKSLNCEKGVSAYPCGQCTSCCEVDEGRFVDLIEVDAASRTKVEDTRDLLDNVQYAPTRGRYKVYLIDEVHMLSNHSFNALLKTLEEPPPHVKFLLATTDPQKLPPTILSRCLQFNLKRLPLEEIIQHLTKIVDDEGLEYETQALRLLAQAADGSLRDALSLLDQAIAYGAGKLSSEDVDSMLGNLDQNVVLELIKGLATNDAPGLLQQISHLAEQNPDFITVLGEMLSLLQQIALAQVVPATVDALDGEAILQLAKQLSPEDVQLFYQIALLGRRDLPLAPEPRGGFEMLMLRMLAFRPDNAAQVPQSEAPTYAIPSPPVSPQVAEPPPPSSGADDWKSIANSLEVKGMVKQLALNCELKQRDSKTWHFSLAPKHKTLLRPERTKQIEELLKKQYSDLQSVHIRVEHPKTETPAIAQQRIQESRQEYAVNAVDNDPFVIYMKENCQAQIKNVQLSVSP
ncbi:DNA polymerase III subunit gamma/tau [Candidatus Thiomargarita nelsonii]|uniref:DNA polymerase III subunit gamma/tau n=1 Tax=Candidatus Thiomargarita nelsonii TaxID=1003181 RepID=A0A4E0R044_9GAMM|nr:DNA polymerase III subunit gamma/tau [Candidatus Thiomargarita nelsonii]